MGTTYRGTTGRGLKLLIELESGTPEVGETVIGTFTFEGDQRPKISGGSVSLVAAATSTSTDVDLFSTLGQVISPEGFDEDSDGPIATKTSTKRSQIANLTAPLHPGGAPADAATFQLPIPLDAPARVASRIFAIRWTLVAKVDTDLGQVTFNVADLPVGIAAGQIGQTPYLEAGALDSVAQGTKEDVEWSIEVEPSPIVAGGSVRGTLLVAPTVKWQKTRPEMKVEAHVVRQNLLPGQLDLIMHGKATDDGVDAEGRRRIRFEADIPAAAPVTTGVGEMRVVATLQINLVRFGFFGPSFKRSVAIASRA